MELFKKNKSTINKIGNGQTQSGRIPITQGTSPLLKGRALGNSTPTLPGTNVPFRNEEQYQRFQGNNTRIPVSPQATQSPTSPVPSLGNMMTGTSPLTRGTSPLTQGNPLGGFNPVQGMMTPDGTRTSNQNDNPMAFGPNMARTVRTDIAPEEMGTEPKRIPVSATENPRLASAGITTDAVYAPTSGDRGIPLSAVSDIPATTPQSTPQIPVGLIGEPGFEQSQRIPAQAPTFDSTLSLQEQINQIENEYNRKAQDIYAEGGLRGMTAGAASSLENVFRQRELSELAPLQQRLELLQNRQESEASEFGANSFEAMNLANLVRNGDIKLSDIPDENMRSAVLSAMTMPQTEMTQVQRLNLDKAQRVIANIDQAISDISPVGTTGIVGLTASILPGTKRKDLEGTIDTIKAAVSFDTLQAMRDASPTGGALGQVSERELDLLGATVQSLKLSQSKDRITQNLQKIEQHYTNWGASIKADVAGLVPDISLNGVQYFINPSDPNTLYSSEEVFNQDIPSFNQSPSQGQDDIVNKIVAIESGGDYNAKNPNSSAFGKYQFIDSTRRQYAQKLGLTDAQSRSPQGQELMFREFTKDNQMGLQQAGYPINAFTTYAAHQQGLGGAKAIFEGRITPKIERNMLANLPQKARLTGDTRNDWINYWSNKLA